MLLSVYEILAIVWTIILTILLFYIAIGIVRYLNRKNALNVYEINIAYNTDDLETKLDQIIQDAITEYAALNISYQNDVYINDKMQDEIRQSVSEDVNNKLSDTMLNKLALLYKTDKIADIIATKIYMAVMLFTIQHDSGKSPTPNS